MLNLKSNKYIVFGPFLVFCIFVLSLKTIPTIIIENIQIVSKALELSWAVALGLMLYLINKKLNFNKKISTQLFDEHPALEWSQEWIKLKTKEKWLKIGLFLIFIAFLIVTIVLSNPSYSEFTKEESNRLSAMAALMFFSLGSWGFYIASNFKKEKDVVRDWVEAYSYFKSQSMETTVKNHLSNTNLIKNTIFENVF